MIFPFHQRYISIDEYYSFIENAPLTKQIIGYSTLKQPIYKIRVGEGSRKILIWSQMHGNESTGTRAMFELLQKLDVSTFTNNGVSIDFIPILNPDGAKSWQRRNALGIDINRDFIQENSTEMKLLKKIAFGTTYHKLINLHDQRTIFAHPITMLPATISVLAPSTNHLKSSSPSQEYLKNWVGSVLESFPELTNQLTRFNDDYYPTSTGDNFTSKGLPCLLIESGHFLEDYQRQSSVEITSNLIEKLVFTNVKGNKKLNYTELPESISTFRDLKIENYPLLIQNQIFRVDICLQYKEEILENSLIFRPMVEEIGDCSLLNFWKVINGNELKPTQILPKIGEQFNNNELFPKGYVSFA